MPVNDPRELRGEIMLRFAAALAVLLSTPALAQRSITGLRHDEPTAVQDDLRGPVRSVRHTHTGSMANDGASVTTYDRMGRRAEMLMYRADDLRSRLVYTYDERGRNTGWESYQVPSRYQGVHMPMKESPPGTPLPDVPERQVYVLDDAGRRTEMHEIGADGTLRVRHTYAYDSVGRVHVMETFYTGQPASRLEIAYDSAGQIVWEDVRTRYDSIGRVREVDELEDGEVRWRTVYRYDGQGRLSEEERRDLKPLRFSPLDRPEPKKVSYTYHPDGSRTVETTRLAPDGTPTDRAVDRFDASGRLVEREEFRPDGTRTPRYVYDPRRGANVETRGLTRWIEEQDAHGNWTRRAAIIIPDDGSPSILWWEQRREITYW